MLKLHDYVLSADCYKVRLLCALLRVTYEVVPVDYFPGRQHLTREYLALNPLGDLPILEDGDLVLGDVPGILAYIAGRHDATGRWLPREMAMLAQVVSWLGFSASRMRAVAEARLHDVLNIPCDIEAARRNGRRAMRLLDDFLADRAIARADWLVGEHPTIADIACFADAALSHDCGIGHEDYPAINLWQRRVRKLPGFVSMPGIPDYF
jgi:glutathione S-transferase